MIDECKNSLMIETLINLWLTNQTFQNLQILNEMRVWLFKLSPIFNHFKTPVNT